MSGRTRKRVIIAGVLLVVFGILMFAIMRRPSRQLTLGFRGFQTNSQGVVVALVSVSNAVPIPVRFGIAADGPLLDLWVTNELRPATATIIQVPLPRQGRSRVIASSYNGEYPPMTGGPSRSTWTERARRHFGRIIRSESSTSVSTMEIPE